MQLVSKISNLCGPLLIHQRHGQTDGQTTCNRNTAICSIVHRPVKTRPIPLTLAVLKRIQSICEHFWNDFNKQRSRGDRCSRLKSTSIQICGPLAESKCSLLEARQRSFSTLGCRNRCRVNSWSIGRVGEGPCNEGS